MTFMREKKGVLCVIIVESIGGPIPIILGGLSPNGKLHATSQIAAGHTGASDTGKTMHTEKSSFEITQFTI